MVDLETGKVLMRFSTGVTTTSLRFSTDGNFLVSSDLNGALYLWRVADIKSEEKRFKKKQQSIDAKGHAGLGRGESASAMPTSEAPVTPKGGKGPSSKNAFLSNKPPKQSNPGAGAGVVGAKRARE